MSPRTKKTVLIAIGIIMALQTAIPALAQTSSLSELSAKIHSMTDEQAASALSQLSKEDKKALLLNLAAALDSDSKKLEDAQLALEDSETVNIVLNASWVVSGGVTAYTFLKALQAELDLHPGVSRPILKVTGVAGIATVALLAGSVYKGMSITVDRQAVEELSKKIETQRRIITHLAVNIIAAE